MVINLILLGCIVGVLILIYITTSSEDYPYDGDS